MDAKSHEEKNDKIESAQPETDRSDETNAGSSSSTPKFKTNREKRKELDDRLTPKFKTNREKRKELDDRLTPVVEREARQQRLKDGTSTEADAYAEARQIEEDASSKSRRILESSKATRC